MQSLDGTPWHLTRAIVSGESAIDVPRLLLTSQAEAEGFLECYGFDWRKPSHRLEVESFRQQAISFLHDELLSGLDLKLPEWLSSQRDVRQVLLWASEPDGARQAWACALLRVMHTVSHAHSYFNDRFADPIRQQILSRFEPHLTLDDEGLQLGKPDGIPLVDFEVKPTKPLNSVVTKLLHKAENVAADIFDRVGVRFITRERFDALLVVKYLRTQNVVMFANIKPSRSRNTLIDLTWALGEIEKTDSLVATGVMTSDEQCERLRELTRMQPYPGPAEATYNPFSAVAYHSVQFTCRQLIRVPGGDGEEIRFFFPFEVQILDQESYQQSRGGLAGHEMYKARQKEAVVKRVLGGLAAGR
jgi:uncharacterized protein (TIGR04562 family)